MICAGYPILSVLVYLFLIFILCKFLYEILRLFYIYGFGALFVKSRLRKYGEWAIVTGCTRGIGLEYCRQLAELGLKLILVARNENLVNKLASDLEREFSIETCVIVCDLDNIDERNFDQILEKIRNKDIGILINNAGIMYDYPEYFDQIPEQLLRQMANVNVMWPTLLSHRVLKNCMQPKKKGLIVFTGSLADSFLTPLLTAYGASKAYTTYLSKCLAIEYACAGIHFQAVSPGYVATDMTKYSKIINEPSWFSPSAQTFVKSALKSFGMTQHCYGYVPHEFQRMWSSLMPECVYGFIAVKWQLYLRNGKNQ